MKKFLSAAMTGLGVIFLITIVKSPETISKGFEWIINILQNL